MHQQVPAQSSCHATPRANTEEEEVHSSTVGSLEPLTGHEQCVSHATEGSDGVVDDDRRIVNTTRRATTVL